MCSVVGRPVLWNGAVVYTVKGMPCMDGVGYAEVTWLVSNWRG